MKNIFGKIFSWLMNFIYIQLLVTLISLPILVWWGIPISLLSPIGNLIFTPLLTIFLFLASLIFFLELFYIPNQWLIYLLEIVTRFWNYLITFGSNGSLIGFAKPPLWFFILVILCVITIIHSKKLASRGKSSIALALLLTATCIFLKLHGKQTTILESIPCKKGVLTFIKDQNTTALIDPGFISSQSSGPSWTEYTLIPDLIKKYGINTIDHVIILKPGIRTFEALESLVRTTCIKNCYCPFWQGNDPALNRSFVSLKKTALNNKTQLHRFDTHQKNITLDTITLELKPHDKKCEYRSVTFSSHVVTGFFANKKIHIPTKP